jgi:DNA-binding GntR family transcriptional regulator
MPRSSNGSTWTRPGADSAGALDSVHRDRLQTFSPPTLKDTAVTYLRAEIMSGRLRPGEKIDQAMVAEALGVSRLPVREALIELTQENLVDTIPRRGCFVSRISPDEIRDVYAIQGYVAGIAARHAATALTEEQLVTLRDLYKQLTKAKGTPAQADLSFAFFRLVLDAGGSNRLRTLLRRLYQSLPVDYFDHLASLFDRTTRYHKQLLAALEAHDGDAAAEVMVRFHDEVGRIVVKHLHDVGLWNS